MKELADFEVKLATYTWMALPDEMLVQAKKFGFADKYLAKLYNVSEKEVRECRTELGCVATFCRVPVSAWPTTKTTTTRLTPACRMKSQSAATARS